MNNQYVGFVVILFVLMTFTLTTISLIQANKPDSSPVNEPGPTTDESALAKLPNHIPVDNASSIDWAKYSDENTGMSFRYPKDWKVVEVMSGSQVVELDIKSPNNEALVLFSASQDNRELSLPDRLEERTKEFSSEEAHRNIEFSSSPIANGMKYEISGDTLYFDLKSTEPFSVDPIWYSFREKGYMEASGKNISLRYLVLPNTPTEAIVAEILSSFVVQL